MARHWVAVVVAALVIGLLRIVPSGQDAEEAPKAKVPVAILLFEGVELLDFAGPAEVFGVAGEGKSFRVFTVAEKTDPVRAMGGVLVKPEFTFQDAPKAAVLVIPGGNTRNVGKAGITWIRAAWKDAEITMSVCMGAFLLAEAGLLDGIEATTHRWGIDNLRQASPRCKVVTNRRFVDTGKIITTAGVTAGIDGALHVVARLKGKEAARWTAEEWMEYKGERSFLDRADKEPDQLAGIWIAASAERQGKPAEDLKGHQLIFKGDTFVIKGKDGEVLYQGTFRTAPAQRPAAIDFRHTKGKLEGKT